LDGSGWFDLAPGNRQLATARAMAMKALVFSMYQAFEFEFTFVTAPPKVTY
jgi:hypothetical protein